MSEPARSRHARHLAEASLVRIVRGYGTVPEFVLIGGLVPDLLCSRSDQLHVGTTDIDVQVDLEIANGSANARRLEEALRGAGFTADAERGWRWQDRTALGLVSPVSGIWKPSLIISPGRGSSYCATTSAAWGGPPATTTTLPRPFSRMMPTRRCTH